MRIDISDKLLRYTLFCSLLIHSAIVLGFYVTHIWSGESASLKRMEISYRSVKKDDTSRSQVLAKKVQKIDALTDKATIPYKEKIPVPPGKGSAYRPENLKVYERQPERVKGLNVTRNISVPALHSEKINTPAYANY